VLKAQPTSVYIKIMTLTAKSANEGLALEGLDHLFVRCWGHIRLQGMLPSNTAETTLMPCLCIMGFECCQ